MDENTDAIPTDEIQLDFAIFVGRRATTDLEHDIVIDSNPLMAFANRFWRRQGRRLQGCRFAFDNFPLSEKALEDAFENERRVPS